MTFRLARQRLIGLCLSTAIVAGLLYTTWPRTPDLRGFDPSAVARIETEMWRAYYERHSASTEPRRPAESPVVSTRTQTFASLKLGPTTVGANGLPAGTWTEIEVPTGTR